ncbi:hypothetical protein DITRI_Ditri12bG0024100 [Diplodiscus trichospermus]
MVICFTLFGSSKPIFTNPYQFALIFLTVCPLRTEKFDDFPLLPSSSFPFHLIDSPLVFLIFHPRLPTHAYPQLFPSIFLAYVPLTDSEIFSFSLLLPPLSLFHRHSQSIANFSFPPTSTNRATVDVRLNHQTKFQGGGSKIISVFSRESTVTGM